MASITLTAHYAAGERRYPLKAGDWTIGSTKDCDIALSDPTVSRQHARLHFDGRDWLLEDLGSSNGVKVNGKATTAATRVQPGDRLQLGSLTCSLLATDTDDLELAVPAEQRSSARTAAARAATAPDRGPTVSSDLISRFYFDTLPTLIRASVRQPESELALTLVSALADSLGGTWLLGRDGAVLAASGTLGPDDRSEQSRAERGRSLSRVARQDMDRDNFEQIAAAVMPLLERAVVAPDPQRKAERNGDAPPFPEPATRYEPLLNLYRQAPRVARSGLNVLIEGGSGTGKELFARYLHACGDDGQPLVTLNCASLPQDLLDAELFGIERGVATGVDARPGKFEQADQGVIFLDEIGDMHLATQAKLLRVLQEQEVYRVGGSQPRPARIQVVSATNRNLDAMVEQGNFRLDLYHRIADWTVRLPSLEERAVDIANLAAHFLARASSEMGQAFAGISRAALDCLLAHRWPGNVRELEREMKR
ncbi:MAG: sigma 54-interacting transcriptional regulator, partial [Wenzhouxiangella sp.]|nr:sigma 54-interacting transcriptional regulator [Wenzhouxiangella sp.]